MNIEAKELLEIETEIECIGIALTNILPCIDILQERLDNDMNTLNKDQLWSIQYFKDRYAAVNAMLNVIYNEIAHAIKDAENATDRLFSIRNAKST